MWKGREQFGRSKGKIKGQLWYHASGTLVPSQWENQIILIGGLHILCWWLRSYPQNQVSHSWLEKKQEAAVHPPCLVQAATQHSDCSVKQKNRKKNSESLPTLSLSVSCIKPPTHTKIFSTSAQIQLMGWNPHEAVQKSYADFATLLLLEFTLWNCNGSGMPRYFACLSRLQLLMLMNFCT